MNALTLEELYAMREADKLTQRIGGIRALQERHLLLHECIRLHESYVTLRAERDALAARVEAAEAERESLRECYKTEVLKFREHDRTLVRVESELAAAEAVVKAAVVFEAEPLNGKADIVLRKAVRALRALTARAHATDAGGGA